MPGREAAAPVADQHPLHRAGDGPAAAERLALGEHGLQRLDQFAAAGRGQAAQPGQVDGQPDGLAGLGRAGRVPGGAQPRQTPATA